MTQKRSTSKPTPCDQQTFPLPFVKIRANSCRFVFRIFAMRQRRSISSDVDPAATQDHIAIEEDNRLAGGDGTLRLVEADSQLVFAAQECNRGLGDAIVANLGLATDRASAKAIAEGSWFE